MVTNFRTYWVDGEIGRFEFITHHIVHEGTVRYNTALDVFPRRKCWEWYKTHGFTEVAFIYGATEESYRQTSRLINRMRDQQEDGTPARTIREQAEGEGAKLLDAIERKAAQILTTHEFSPTGTFEGHPETYQGQQAVTVPEARVADAIAVCQAHRKVACDLRENPILYEAPEATVNISIDDVGVKRQKVQRTGHEEADPEGRSVSSSQKRKYVHNTVIHIEKNEKSSLITGHGLHHVLSLLIAFLLQSDLVQYRFQFFTDGYTVLHEAIRRCFSWYKNLGILLDWYHLEEKCQLQLSLAMKGRMMRNEALNELLPLLWYGLVDHAIAFVKRIDASQLKNPDALTQLIGYFERNRAHIPCYAVRKELGLRNSSQIGEKMNDLVVAERQKHKGMSWSVSGSIALASLTALTRNHEYAMWFEEGNIEFKLAA